MAWIESHQTLEKHGKLLGLVDALAITKHQAIGHLHCLWWWAIDSAPLGDISKYSASTIASAAGWNEYQEYAYELNQAHDFPKAVDAGRFVAALLACGFLDGELNPDKLPKDGPIGCNLRIHDWLDFCGDLVKKRLERLSEKRNRQSGIKSPPIEGRNVPPTVPYRTVPYRTIPTNQTKKAFIRPSAQDVTAYGLTLGSKVDGSQFCDFYESKGWKIGNAPMKSWQAAVRNWIRRDHENGNGVKAPPLPKFKESIPDPSEIYDPNERTTP